MKTPELHPDYRERLQALGFSVIEVGLIQWALLRMGMLDFCEHTRPRFAECYELDEDGAINEARWQRSMHDLGFRSDAIALAEHGLGLCMPDCPYCVRQADGTGVN